MSAATKTPYNVKGFTFDELIQKQKKVTEYMMSRYQELAEKGNNFNASKIMLEVAKMKAIELVLKEAKKQNTTGVVINVEIPAT